jgi:hypothetical protein
MKLSRSTKNELKNFGVGALLLLGFWAAHSIKWVGVAAAFVIVLTLCLVLCWFIGKVIRTMLGKDSFH